MARPIYITLTTIPPRFGGIVAVLESLLAQGADGVILALPEVWTRFPGVQDLPSLPDGVTVLRCADLGPATKVLPARAAFPEADLVYCDDDCLYGPSWLDALRAGTGVRAASVFDVARLKRRGGRVAQGFAGVFVSAEVSLPSHVPEAVRWVDDLWLSAWFEAHHAPIQHVPEAGALVTPLVAAEGLQAQDRAAQNARAVEYIHERLAVWPTL